MKGIRILRKGNTNEGRRRIRCKRERVENGRKYRRNGQKIQEKVLQMVDDNLELKKVKDLKGAVRRQLTGQGEEKRRKVD